MANTIDTVDFDALAPIWLETYGNCEIRATFASESVSPRHLEEKRALTKQIVSFLQQNNAPYTPLCIEKLIDAIEPVEDTRDYDSELGDSEEMDSDTEEEDYLGC